MENAIDSEIPGADLPSHVRVLERHFKQNGTPVIIGRLLFRGRLFFLLAMLTLIKYRR
jgi:hypothetical protein